MSSPVVEIVDVKLEHPDVKEVLDVIVKDELFLENFKKYLPNLVDGGHINPNELLNVLHLITETYNKLSAARLSPDGITLLVLDVFDNLNEKFKFIGDEKKEYCHNIIKSGLKLLMLTPIVNNMKCCLLL